MKCKRVKNIAEELSVVGFGCWAISGEKVWNNTDDRHSIQAVQRAVDLGVNFFDVAPIYGLGYAEEILGKALEGRRDDVFLATKCGLVWDEQKNVEVNLTAESLEQEIEQSLQRLQTDRIDLYQIHWPDPNTPIEETMGALEDIKHSGKIRYIGVSNFSVELTQQAMQVGSVASHQGLYNLLEPNAESYHNIPLTYRVEQEILPFCQEHGMAFFPYSPLFQGLLTGSFQAADNFNEQDVRAANPKLNGENFQKYFAVTEELKAFAREIGKPLSQVAMNWLIRQEVVTSIIAGAQNIQHVEENVASVEWELSDDMLARIKEIVEPYAL